MRSALIAARTRLIVTNRAIQDAIRLATIGALHGATLRRFAAAVVKRSTVQGGAFPNLELPHRDPLSEVASTRGAKHEGGTAYAARADTV
jgi:hypothetical protein